LTGEKREDGDEVEEEDEDDDSMTCLSGEGGKGDGNAAGADSSRVGDAAEGLTLFPLVIAPGVQLLLLLQLLLSFMSSLRWKRSYSQPQPYIPNVKRYNTKRP
jgi:hypothetical protein